MPTELEDDLNYWATLWQVLHPRLAKLASEAGDARAKAELVQFAVDLDRIAKFPERLRVIVPNLTRETTVSPKQERRHAPAIVLVEDEPDLLIIYHRLFRDWTGGYDIVAVTSGEDALAQIVLRDVPLVVTDYNMPGMNGLQLTSAIKEVSPATKVVLATAYATPDLERKAKKHGVDYYFAKPFPLSRMEQVVREALLV